MNNVHSFVKGPDGRSAVVRTSHDYKVIDIKEAVAHIVKMRPMDQSMEFQGKLLLDDHYLHEYSLYTAATVQLFGCLKGGGPNDGDYFMCYFKYGNKKRYIPIKSDDHSSLTIRAFHALIKNRFKWLGAFAPEILI